jgi:hypothetical protein
MAGWFRSLVRQVMFRAHTHIAGRPHLDAFIKQSLARVPLLDRRLRAVVRTQRQSRFQAIPATRVATADLTPRAYRVYLDLVRALKHGQ